MPLDAVLVIDKPAGWTSHDVVARLRRVLSERSAGHLGTLDPMATGVLPVVLGRYTRLSQFYNHSEKSYEGEIRFGFATNTYDAEGETVGEAQTVQVALEGVREASREFVGPLSQLPPPFSAKKINGVPAYKLARKNVEVELKPSAIEVFQFEVFEGSAPDRIGFRAHVSSGTYIRSLAHDLGQKLGCGAHLASLRRTTVAEFTIDQAHTLEAVETAVAKGNPEELFVHPRRILPQLPCVTANDETVAYIRNGRAVNLPEFSKAKLVKVFAGQAEIVCVAQRIAGTLFHPKLVMPANQLIATK
ncbi:tRNA pseudouridine synthase B [Candidatus Koribacter versatilis Ellin345]|uniref:tRNA pseudouridine synthase B n=1 Tax=Koribacter versatilis (strain Ellin345) TaxID=204669 RepID=Q1IPJ6_KORVE|nr:tRNA pseudouridine(55) synthase TruB [Candidatus Koribacter versatilis]ABF41204.1 tRNA pseudouridine synthase B [Candidatus Koribacter versatilis Ellin345]